MRIIRPVELEWAELAGGGGWLLNGAGIQYAKVLFAGDRWHVWVTYRPTGGASPRKPQSWHSELAVAMSCAETIVEDRARYALRRTGLAAFQ